MYQNDYILREIERLNQIIASIVFDKELDTLELVEENGTLSAEAFLLHRLRNMVAAGQINEAENLLFAEIEERHDPLLFPVAVSFYQDLAALSPKFIEANHYTREEIAEGLRVVTHIYDAENN